MVFLRLTKWFQPTATPNAGSTLAKIVSTARHPRGGRIDLHTSRQSNESAIQREQCHHLQFWNVVSRYALSDVRDISLTTLCDCKDDSSPEQEGNQ